MCCLVCWLPPCVLWLWPTWVHVWRFLCSLLLGARQCYVSREVDYLYYCCCCSVCTGFFTMGRNPANKAAAAAAAWCIRTLWSILRYMHLHLTASTDFCCNHVMQVGCSSIQDAVFSRPRGRCIILLDGIKQTVDDLAAVTAAVTTAIAAVTKDHQGCCSHHCWSSSKPCLPNASSSASSALSQVCIRAWLALTYSKWLCHLLQSHLLYIKPDHL